MDHLRSSRGTLILILSLCYFVKLTTQHGFEVDPEQDPVNSLRRSDFIRDKDHMKGHIKGMDFNPDEATPEELDFHFFNLHDINQDDRLDGLEMLSALRHHALSSRQAREKQEDSMAKPSHNYDKAILRQCIAIVDKILKDDDADGDGYIDYAEFAHTRRASELLHQITTRPDKQTPL